MTIVINTVGEVGERRWARFEKFIQEGLVGGSMEAVDACMTLTPSDHQDYGPGFPPGRDGVKALTAALLQAIPDMQSDIEEIVLVEHESWARIRSWGTFSGPYLGIPATNRPISIYVVESVRWTDDDLIDEHWGVADRFGLMIQMGLIAPEYVPVWRIEVAGPTYVPPTPGSA